jgi:hypothetical protein
MIQQTSKTGSSNKGGTMRSQVHHPVNPALTRAISAALPSITPPAPHGATKTHTAPQLPPRPRRTNPPRPLNPNQLTAARLLLAGHSVTAVAAALHVDPYTVSRWKKDPRFQSELHYQTALLSTAAPHGATRDHTAPQIPRAGAERTQISPP